MITDFADLLNAFIQKEVESLDRQNIDHPPTIGAMYEGLTQALVNRTIPAALKLRVVSGFITNDAGELSRQIDCMLVVGDGEQVPHTNQYTYHVTNVIAVLEVKKKLYSKDISSAYANLYRVKEIHQYKPVDFRLALGAYRLIVGKQPPDRDAISVLPLLEEQIYRTLLIEEVLPVRIVIGYHGFATEQSFRESFVQFLASHPQETGYGPQSLPNLIICGQYSIVKLNGMPYASPLMALGGIRMWPLLVSYASNPLIPLLELIWTRLTFHFNLAIDGYNDDLSTEIMKTLLLTWPEESDAETGWHYFYLPIDEAALQSAPVAGSWQPVTINEAQAAILIELGEVEAITVDDEFEAANEDGGDVDSLLKPLIDARLISREGNRLILLTRQCEVAFLPDGTIVAAENVDGRLSRWVVERSETARVEI